MLQNIKDKYFFKKHENAGLKKIVNMKLILQYNYYQDDSDI